MIEELKPCPEMVEKVARAISNAAYDNMRAQGFSGGWDHDELGRAIAEAAVSAYDPDKRLREALVMARRYFNREVTRDKTIAMIDAALSHNGG
jgi:hypothetical protein